MKKVRVRDTGPEMAVRRLLFASGMRYRVNFRPKEPDIGRSSVDIAFPGKRLAIFVDGCFWHGCPEHGELPRANREWWERKFAENRERDARLTGQLEKGGWRVLRFWAHESPEEAFARIQDVLSYACKGAQKR
jgi:DNA mismatch endonuclease (patch repair protein)